MPIIMRFWRFSLSVLDKVNAGWDVLVWLVTNPGRVWDWTKDRWKPWVSHWGISLAFILGGAIAFYSTFGALWGGFLGALLSSHFYYHREGWDHRGHADEDTISLRNLWMLDGVMGAAGPSVNTAALFVILYLTN